jgi:hypothetical protein
MDFLCTRINVELLFNSDVAVDYLQLRFFGTAMRLLEITVSSIAIF